MLRRLDPCPGCSDAGLTCAPDGKAVAFLARDRARNVITLMLARGTTLTKLATISGLASTPRFSPDGTRIALLVTLGATKETGATQAGARQIGEIGVASDEQRLANVRVGAAPGAAVTPLSPMADYTRRLARNTPYAAWFADLEA